MLKPIGGTIVFEDDAVICAGALAGNQAANHIALDQLQRTLFGVAITAAATGGHAHAITGLQWAIFGFVKQLGFRFPVLEDQHLTRLGGFRALYAPGWATDAVEVRPQFARR